MSQQIDSAFSVHSLKRDVAEETPHACEIAPPMSRVSRNVRPRPVEPCANNDEESTLINVEERGDLTAFLHKRTLKFSHRKGDDNGELPLLLDFDSDDIPSPPTSSSSDRSMESKGSGEVKDTSTNKRPPPNPSTSAMPRPYKKLKLSSKGAPLKRPRYYLKAFNFVIEHVLKRYADILQSVDVELIRLMRRAAISENALSLFVRLYRRQQPQWFRVEKLQNNYDHEIDVDTAIVELSRQSLLISSKFALSTSSQKASSSTAPGSSPDSASAIDKLAPPLAKELLSTLSMAECKTVCSSIADGAKIRKLNKRFLLPSLKQVLVDEQERKKAQSSRKHGARSKKAEKTKFQQSTLSGLSQADCLSKAVLRVVGHCIRIPPSVLKTFQRVHFLFFLDAGYDSANVVLADTQKVRFPKYKCEPSDLIFLSARGFKDYEEAIKLERAIIDGLEAKKYEKVANLGSIAELEVREFFGSSSEGNTSAEDVGSVNEEDGIEQGEESDADGGNQSKYRWLSIIPYTHRQFVQLEVETQLQHPFFKRYTAIWVYVRACWYSVHALERLGEHESAIERLKLLLSSSLMPRRRGKCLNRLTINLERHVKRLQEALDIIIDALQPGAPKLNFGDRIQLAMRGASIHRKLYTSEAEKTVNALSKKSMKLNARKKAVALETTTNRPKAITDVLNDLEFKVAIQRIYGQSIQQRVRDQMLKDEEVGEGEGDDHGESQNWFNKIRQDVSNSRDSVLGSASMILSGAPSGNMMGKSLFSSFHDSSNTVTVEEYCLEWYYAKQGWHGVHDEGASIRFLFCLLMWEQALFADVSDVFQTPYQDRPLDLMTEAFYESRKGTIEERLVEIDSMSSQMLYKHVIELYNKYEGTRAVGCIWDQERYPSHMLACVAAGLGGSAVARSCALLCEDFSYWGAGLPDLTLWRDGGVTNYSDKIGARLVEVKSARDNLSDKQRAWLFQLMTSNADCQVCKVVERVTAQNAEELGQAMLSYQALKALKAEHQR